MFIIDEIDYHILDLLKENARESISSISKKVNLSRPSVKERILRMEENGIIEKYTINVRVEQIKNQIVFYTLLSNVKFTGDAFFKYMHEMSEIHEIKSIDVVTGKASYLIKAIAYSTDEMNDMLKKFLKISSIESFIILKHHDFD